MLVRTMLPSFSSCKLKKNYLECYYHTVLLLHVNWTDTLHNSLQENCISACWSLYWFTSVFRNLKTTETWSMVIVFSHNCNQVNVVYNSLCDLRSPTIIFFFYRRKSWFFKPECSNIAYEVTFIVCFSVLIFHVFW